LGDFSTKSWQIWWHVRSNQFLVHDHFFIHVSSSRVHQIVFDRPKARGLAPSHDPSGAKHSAPVADGRDHLPGLTHSLNEFQNTVVLAQEIQNPTARDNDGSEITRASLGVALVSNHRITFLACIRLPGLSPQGDGLCAGSVKLFV